MTYSGLCINVFNVYQTLFKNENLSLQVIALSLWHAHLKQHNGRMAKIVQKMYEEKNQKEIMEEMQYVVRANKWNHIGDILQKVITAFPASYRLF